MKITHITHTEGVGGAARAAYLLHRGLLALGLESQMLVSQKTSADPTVYPLQHASSLTTRLLKKVDRFTSQWKYADFSEAKKRGNDSGLTPVRLVSPEWAEQIPRDHIIHLHSIAGRVDLSSLFKHAAPSHRYVWTLHDYWPMTGGCHYPSTCRLYEHQCGSCIHISSNNKKDITFKIWRDKNSSLSLLSNRQLTVVSPSKKLADDARTSSLMKRFEIHNIPYGIDTIAFSPRCQAFSRDSLGLAQNSFVIAFVAEWLTTPRKGFAVLLKALQWLKEYERISIIAVGSGNLTQLEGYRVCHLGALSNDNLLSIAYSSADVFISPAREDNLPLTVLEAMACGTPVLGSDVGGIPDMVEHGKTGYLFPSGESLVLASLIAELVEDRSKTKSMRTNCRVSIEQRYSLEIQAAQYRSLYRKILASPLRST